MRNDKETFSESRRWEEAAQISVRQLEAAQGHLIPVAESWLPVEEEGLVTETLLVDRAAV